jgi:hypothetical protein
MSPKRQAEEARRTLANAVPDPEPRDADKDKAPNPPKTEKTDDK